MLIIEKIKRIEFATKKGTYNLDKLPYEYSDLMKFKELILDYQEDQSTEYWETTDDWLEILTDEIKINDDDWEFKEENEKFLKIIDSFL